MIKKLQPEIYKKIFNIIKKEINLLIKILILFAINYIKNLGYYY